MSVRRLRWDLLFPSGQSLHVARAGLSQARHLRPHGHDFYECFLVEKGKALHWVDGEEQRVVCGELHWIGPGQVHGFKVQGASGFQLVNLAVRAGVVERFLDRHDGAGAVLSGWCKGEHARMGLLPVQMERVTRLVQGISTGGREELDAEYFLCALTRLLARNAPEGREGEGPEWLRLALVVAQEPEHLRAGFSALVRLCGRSAEHISRSFRMHVGKTPTEWITQKRIERARLLLETGAAPIQEIAFEAGFENLSHFHRSFKAQTGMTPLRYRRTHQVSLF